MAYHLGGRIYLDREQCEYFGVSYEEKGEDLIVAADAVLNSRAPHKGYDASHVMLLHAIGQNTMVLESTGYGWYNVVNVIEKRG